MAESKVQGRPRAEATVSLGELTPKNVGQLRVLNDHVFPVKYNDNFYNTIVEEPKIKFSHLAYFGYDVLAGAICTRLEQPEKKGDATRLYIMTLAVLEPYRRYGIGTKLVKYVLDTLCQDKKNHVQQVYLHVQENNKAALDFYAKFGFRVAERVENYYKNIEPPHCFKLVKDISLRK
eukprot:m51a1_g842 hypothetical protein (177) ;mRNA; r:766983-767752